MLLDSSMELNENMQFEDLIRPHIDYLYKISYRFTGNKSDAEDLLQDLLVKIFIREQQLFTIEQLRPWLVRVLYRLFLDNLRKQKRFLYRRVAPKPEDPDPLGIISGNNPDPEEQTQTNELHEKIGEALNLLSKDQRAVITLHDIEGYKLVELKKMLDIPIGTLKSRLHRARANLKKILTKWNLFHKENVHLDKGVKK